MAAPARDRHGAPAPLRAPNCAARTRRRRSTAVCGSRRPRPRRLRRAARLRRRRHARRCRGAAARSPVTAAAPSCRRNLNSWRATSSPSGTPRRSCTSSCATPARAAAAGARRDPAGGGGGPAEEAGGASRDARQCARSSPTCASDGACAAAEFTDVSATLMPRVRDLVGGNLLLLVGTKLDLLLSAHADAVHRWLESTRRRGSTSSACGCSSRTAPASARCAHDCGGARRARRYLVGAANVGSRSLRGADRRVRRRPGRSRSAALASSTPGTTLRVIPFDVFSVLEALRHAGRHLAHRTPAQLTPAEFAAVAPRRAIRPFTPAEPAVAGTSYFWAGRSDRRHRGAAEHAPLVLRVWPPRPHRAHRRGGAAHAANAGAEWTPPSTATPPPSSARSRCAAPSTSSSRRWRRRPISPSPAGWVPSARSPARRGDGPKKPLDVWLPKGLSSSSARRCRSPACPPPRWRLTYEVSIAEYFFTARTALSHGRRGGGGFVLGLSTRAGGRAASAL